MISTIIFELFSTSFCIRGEEIARRDYSNASSGTMMTMGYLHSIASVHVYMCVHVCVYVCVCVNVKACLICVFRELCDFMFFGM